MPDNSVALPTRALCVEASKNALICAGAATAIGFALPYSLDFAFQTVTHLGFAVALTEGAISTVADLLDAPHYALKKITEAVETLCASIILAAASLGVQTFF
jgi:hypothetical protein